jgi:hypothetical protein
MVDTLSTGNNTMAFLFPTFSERIRTVHVTLSLLFHLSKNKNKLNTTIQLIDLQLLNTAVSPAQNKFATLFEPHDVHFVICSCENACPILKH